MRRLTEFVLRHKALVVLTWLVLLFAGGAASGKITDRLVLDFSLPGQPGYETSQQILDRYGNGGFDPYLLQVQAPAGQRIEAIRPQVEAAFTALAQQVPTARLVTRATSGDPSFTAPDGRTEFAYAFLPFPTSFEVGPEVELKKALAALTAAGKLTPTATGLAELALNSGTSQGPGVLVEVLFGALGALLVLAFVFASFLALLPLLVAAFSILTTFLILLGLTYVTDVSFVVQFLVALIGLGVAIDYSLIVVTRWREERDHGKDPHEAVVAAMATAGKSVVFSGVTVAIGLLALVVVPVPLLRSMTFGGVLIPVISTLVSLTLLPVLLATVGRRLDWPRIRQENTASRSWSRWARLVVRRRWLAAAVGALAILLLAAPALGIKVGTSSSDSLSRSGPAFDAMEQLKAGGLPAGILTPMEVLTTPAAAQAVASSLRSVDGILAAYPAGGRSVKGEDAIVVVVPRIETASTSNVDVVRRVQAAVDDNPAVVGVSGAGPTQIDYVNAVYKNFPYVLLIIVVLTFVLLARAFRSLLLPLKAVILNLLSLAATFGGMVLFWQLGYGSNQVFSISATGAITFWLPVLIFAFLYGLSMDYEVFILARIREEYDNSASTDEAVIEGIGRTGRLVTSAALILFLAFISLGSGPQTDIKVFATGLGFGILLDATVVRSLLVPALVSLFGHWNWWLPEGAAKLLRVAPSLPHAEPARRQGALAD